MLQIYSKPNCPNCDKAKMITDSMGVKYATFIVDKDFTIEDLYQIAPRSHRSYPMVALNGEYLGGLRELKQHLGVE